MSILDKIRKRREDSEDQSYYKDESPSGANRLTSVLFGLFALFVTLLIAAGLFFGGRAVYRALNGDSPAETTTPASQSSEQEAVEQETNETSSDTTGNDGQSSGSNNTPSAGDTPTEPQSTPSTGDTPSSSLPRTGDEGL